MKRPTLIFLLFIVTTSTFACTCDFPGNVNEEFALSDFVFIGKVTSKTLIETEKGVYFQIEIELRETYKGEFLSNKISILTEPPLPACGYYFKVGKIYAIYAFSDDSIIRTGQCTRTTRAWRKERKEIKTRYHQG